MALLQTNATISVLRGMYNDSTKRTAAPAPVVGLATVPVFMDEIGVSLRAQGMTPEYDLMMLWDIAYDIRDGDRIVGYNPGHASVSAIFLVQHAASDGIGTNLECRICMLKAVRPAGSST